MPHVVLHYRFRQPLESTIIMRKQSRPSLLLKKAHRQAVALNPHPKYTCEWPDRRRAYKSQRSTGVNLIYCQRIMVRLYHNTSLQDVINQFRTSYNTLASILTTLQGIRLITDEPRSKNNPKTKEITPGNAIWREHVTPVLPYTFPKSRANEHPSTAHAMESENLLNLVVVLKTLDTCADLCLDFHPALIQALQALHTELCYFLATIRPTWQLPKFKTQLLHPTHVIRPPAKYIKHRQFSDEWRQAQRKKWHKEQRDGN